MSEIDEETGSLEDVGLTLADFDEVSGVLTPDDLPYIGNEPRTVLAPDTLPEDSQEKSSRIKTGYVPPSGKVAELPARGGGIPTIDEWLDFFSRVVIRVATDFAIEMSFRGIDEEWLTDAEVQKIKLSDDERDRIAKPFAEFAYRNKFTRKHGREIIAAAGSIDAILQIGLWYTRMTRIAMKYRRMANHQGPPRTYRRSQTENATHPTVQTVVTIQPEEVIDNERFGQSTPNASQNGHDRGWRPNVDGYVANPGG